MSFMKSLSINPEEFDGKLISIYEKHGCDSSFALSALIADCLALPETAVQVLLTHHSYDHLFHSCLRLGVNLNSRKDRFEALQLPPVFVHDTELNFIKDSDDFRTLIKNLEKNNKKFFENNKKVYIFIDSIFNLFYFSENLRNVKLFIHYLRSLLKNNVTIIVSTQHSSNDKDQNEIKSLLETLSSLNIYMEPLKMGATKDVSGSIKLHLRDSLDKIFHDKIFHYKLTEKQVKVFVPGNIL